MSSCPRCAEPRPSTGSFCPRCGGAFEKPAPAGPTAPLAATAAASGPAINQGARPGEAHGEKLPAGAVVDNKYVIAKVLGEGGMGVVYLARDRNIGTEVVLKAVRAELAHRHDVRDRLLAEGKALARIDHPNVVRFNAVVVEGPALWLVMQYVEGESLDVTLERLNRLGQRMPVSDALRTYRQVLEGVAAAHREGLIHRDLKPANVLVRGKDGVAKVGDFGIVKQETEASQGKGATRGTIGSLWYMSPEQVMGLRDLDRRVDVYALGIMLFEMLAGRVPFDAESDFELMRLQAEAPIPSLLAERSDVPPAVDDVIRRATAKNREHRFASCEELLQALDGVESTAATHAPAWRGHAARATVATPPPPEVLAGAAIGSARGAVNAVERHGALVLQETQVGDAATHSPYAAGLPLGAHPGVTTTAGHAFDGSSALAMRPPNHDRVAPQAESSTGGGKLVAAIGVGALVAVGAVIFFASRTEETAAVPSARPSTRIDAAATPKTGAAAPREASPPADSALTKLAGKWRTVDTQRDFDAVVVGDAVEFRISDGQQFGSVYRSGDVRFVLRPRSDSPGAYTVTDQPRVPPPSNMTATTDARTTCTTTIETVDGRPLEARLENDTLSVEPARFEPTIRNYTIVGNQVTSCVGLTALPLSRLPAIRLMRR